MRMFDPPHPGFVLKEFRECFRYGRRSTLGVTRAALSRILNGSAGISAEMALRLSDALGTSPDIWIGMQGQYDLWQASKKGHRKLPRLQIA